MSRPVIPPKIQLMSRPERVWRLRATLTNILGRGGRSLARPLFSGHAVHVSERPWRCWRRWTGIEPESGGVALCHLVVTCVNTCRSGGISAPGPIQLVLSDVAQSCEIRDQTVTTGAAEPPSTAPSTRFKNCSHTLNQSSSSCVYEVV